MDSRTKKEIIGVSLIGAALAVGVAISNRKKIKREYDIKKYNFLKANQFMGEPDSIQFLIILRSS